MKKDIDVDALKRLYYEKKLSVSRVAIELGVSSQRVYDFMDRHGLKRRSRSEAQKNRFEMDNKGPSTEEILRLYFDEELSSFAVADRVGLSQSMVVNRIEKAGYRLRTHSEAHSIRKFGRVFIEFTDAQKIEIRRLYCDEKFSLAVIGLRFEVSPQIIKRALVGMDVEMRTLKESQELRRDREIKRYEKRTTEKVGEIFENLEDPVLKVIQLFRSGNFLLDEIALKCTLSRLRVYEILRDAGLLPDF